MTEDKHAEVLRRIGLRLDEINQKLELLLRKGSRPKHNGHAHEFVEGPVVLTIPVLGGKTFDVRQSLIDEFGQLYPEVDVKQTMNEIRAWALSNPSKRKTEGGMMRCINTWLSKEQNR